MTSKIFPEKMVLTVRKHLREIKIGINTIRRSRAESRVRYAKTGSNFFSHTKLVFIVGDCMGLQRSSGFKIVLFSASSCFLTKLSLCWIMLLGLWVFCCQIWAQGLKYWCENQGLDSGSTNCLQESLPPPDRRFEQKFSDPRVGPLGEGDF